MRVGGETNSMKEGEAMRVDVWIERACRREAANEG